MVKEEELKVLIGEQHIDGFRKGITKTKILSDLTPEDWVRIDQMKQAEELKVNDNAYQVMVRNDQLYVEWERVKLNIKKNLADLLQYSVMLDSNEVDMKTGIMQKDDKGIELTVRDVEIINMKVDVNCQRLIQLIRADLSTIYTFVGRKRLDKVIFFKEEDYNAIFKDVVHELSRTKYKIY